jgi:serine protease Do
VDPNGAAARDVSVGDVVESINGAAIGSFDEWDVRSRRLSAGEAVTIDVRRRGATRRVQLMAAPMGDPAGSRQLGLTVRYVPGLGSEVLAVDRGSAADGAGLRPGDLITTIGSSQRPTPARLRQAYADAAAGEAMLVGLTRSQAPQVVALVK